MLELRVIPVRGMGDIKPGDVLVDKMLGALRRQRVRLIAGDILVVTHKIVSKAAGRVVPLEQVKASGGLGGGPRGMGCVRRWSSWLCRKAGEWSARGAAS